MGPATAPIKQFLPDIGDYALLVMGLPHRGHCFCVHGIPRSCGAVAPQSGHTHSPPGPRALPPPLPPAPVPRPCPPFFPPPRPCPPRILQFLRIFSSTQYQCACRAGIDAFAATGTDIGIDDSRSAYGDGVPYASIGADAAAGAQHFVHISPYGPGPFLYITAGVFQKAFRRSPIMGCGFAK